MITKNLIHENFTYEDEFERVTTREQFCDLIDRWKSLLVTRGAERGNSLGISLIQVNVNHLALIFAAGELGLKLILLDKPICRETIPATKAALFAPIDYHVIDTYSMAMEDYAELVKRYCKNNILEDEILEHQHKFTEIICEDDDVYLCASTSGTTGNPMPVYYTQQHCHELAIRHAKIFGFTENSVVCHTRNMHHVSCMTTFLLPSILTSSKHYYYNIYHIQDGLFDFMKRKNVDQVFFGSHFLVESMLKFEGVFDVAPKINISGFTVPEEYIDYCRKYNVEFMSHYGSVDTGTLLVNHVNKDSQFIPNWLGKEPDDYFELMWNPQSGLVEVCGPWGPKPRTLEDYISPRSDGIWCHFGRHEKNVTEEVLRNVTGKDLTVIDDHIVFWEDCNFPQDCRYRIHHLDKKTWTTETKINMHQLRYFLKNSS